MLLSLIDIFLTNNATKVVKGIKAFLQSMEENIFFRSESVFTFTPQYFQQIQHELLKSPCSYLHADVS